MNDGEFITVKEFVFSLWNAFCGKDDIKNDSEFLKNLHQQGFIEDVDERFSEKLLDKRTAARIIHTFMLKKLKIQDLTDISSAEVLKDLYTCHTCVNHIAQVFLRKIIDAEEVSDGKNIVLIFNVTKTLSRKEAFKTIQKLQHFIADSI